MLRCEKRMKVEGDKTGREKHLDKEEGAEERCNDYLYIYIYFCLSIYILYDFIQNCCFRHYVLMHLWVNDTYM